MSAVTWLGQASDTSANAAAWETYVRALRDNLTLSFARASAARATLKATRERLGLPFMVGPGEGAARTGAWDSGLEQDFIELGSMVATLTNFADDAIAGRRKLGFDQGDQLAFERLDGDFSRVEVRNGRPVQVENATGNPVVVTGTVSALPALVVGLIAVAAAVTTYFVVAEVCDTVENVAETKQIETLSANSVELIKTGRATPEQAKAINDSIYQGAATVHEARAAEATAGRSEIPQTIRTIGFVALGLAALYIVAQFFMRRGGGGALVPARMLENPVRRSGDVRVNIKFRDREDDYAGTVTWPGGRWRFDQLRLSPHMRGRIAADSSQAYDEAARAAISFGADEHEEIYAHADLDDRGEVKLSRRLQEN
jgi:hypothetical protein